MTGWLALCLVAVYLTSLIFDYKLLKHLFYLDIISLMAHALKASWQFSYVIWSLHALTGSSCPAQLFLLCVAFRSHHDLCMFCIRDIWYIDTWFHCLVLLFDWIAFGFLWSRCHWNWYSFLDHYCIYHTFGLILWSLVMILWSLVIITIPVKVILVWKESDMNIIFCIRVSDVVENFMRSSYYISTIHKWSLLMVIGISSLGYLIGISSWCTWCQS